MTPGARVALRNDSYTLHVLLPTKVRAEHGCKGGGAAGKPGLQFEWAEGCNWNVGRGSARAARGLFRHTLGTPPHTCRLQVDPLVSLMKVEKVRWAACWGGQGHGERPATAPIHP